jgi:hypothetical protein
MTKESAPMVGKVEIDLPAMSPDKLQRLQSKLIALIKSEVEGDVTGQDDQSCPSYVTQCTYTTTFGGTVGH